MLSRAGSPCLLSTEVRVTMLLCCRQLQPLPGLQLRAPSPSDKFTKLTPTSRGLSTNSEHCANIYNEIEIVQSQARRNKMQEDGCIHASSYDSSFAYSTGCINLQ